MQGLRDLSLESQPERVTVSSLRGLPTHLECLTLCHVRCTDNFRWLGDDERQGLLLLRLFDCGLRAPLVVPSSLAVLGLDDNLQLPDEALDLVPAGLYALSLNRCTRLTDLGFTKIAKCRSLLRLELAETSVSDECVTALITGWPHQLHYVNLTLTPVSAELLQWLSWEVKSGSFGRGPDEEPAFYDLVVRGHAH
jgi:hypothetical protein